MNTDMTEVDNYGGLEGNGLITITVTSTKVVTVVDEFSPQKIPTVESLGK